MYTRAPGSLLMRTDPAIEHLQAIQLHHDGQ